MTGMSEVLKYSKSSSPSVEIDEISLDRTSSIICEHVAKSHVMLLLLIAESAGAWAREKVETNEVPCSKCYRLAKVFRTSIWYWIDKATRNSWKKVIKPSETFENHQQTIRKTEKTAPQFGAPKHWRGRAKQSSQLGSHLRASLGRKGEPSWLMALGDSSWNQGVHFWKSLCFVWLIILFLVSSSIIVILWWLWGACFWGSKRYAFGPTRVVWQRLWMIVFRLWMMTPFPRLWMGFYHIFCLHDFRLYIKQGIFARQRWWPGHESRISIIVSLASSIIFHSILSSCFSFSFVSVFGIRGHSSHDARTLSGKKRLEDKQYCTTIILNASYWRDCKRRPNI